MCACSRTAIGRRSFAAIRYLWAAAGAYLRARRRKCESRSKNSVFCPPETLIFSVEQVKRQREVFGDDPWKYGIVANRTMIDMVQTYSAEQGLTPKKQPWDEVFPEELLLSEEKFGLTV